MLKTAAAALWPLQDSHHQGEDAPRRDVVSRRTDNGGAPSGVLVSPRSSRIRASTGKAVMLIEIQ